MPKDIIKTINDCKLIKIEKMFNQSEKQKFFYNFHFEDIDDILLVETYSPIEPGLIGKKIKYKLNSENEVSDFEFLT